MLAPVTGLAKSPEAMTAEGAVAGTSVHGIDVFRGIPFAAAPTGPNRWRSPQPAAPWKGVRVAQDFAPDCMQTPSPTSEAPLRTTPSEDCLYLNVWKPAAAKKGAKQPVLVWIYGGAFIRGGSSPASYDGTAFARAGIVFVSFNYRVGRFGFFSHPALSAEAGKPVGNFAMEDQVAALKWVRANIPSFGGDPAKVTIMGESAGGTAVINLLTMPSAQGLFRGAIAMSGGGRSLLPTATQKRGEQVGIDFAMKHGISDTGVAGLAALRALPAEAVRGSDLFADRFAHPSTYVGGYVAEGSVLVGQSDTLMEAGKFAKVPVMIGMTSADGGLTFARDKEALYASFGEHGPALRRLYDPQGLVPFDDLSRRLTGDQYMAEPARFVARHVAASGQKAWVYRFGYVAESKRAEWPAGAPHATDIPYFFNTVEERYGSLTTALDRKAATLAHRYVVNFVKSGDPNGRSLPAWPTYNRLSEAVLQHNMDAEATSTFDPFRERLDILEQVANSWANK
ncbi:carboxylesterase/lipase family protein [Novosphingobium piscinae]